MSNKVNFKQALKELAGFDEPQEGSQDHVIDVDYVDDESILQTFQNKKEEAEIKFEVAPLKNHSVHEAQIGLDRSKGSVISSTMVINGNVKANQDLVIDGCVYGDVNTSSNIILSNVVVGNIKAQNIEMDSARVKGNVKINETVKVDESTIIVGDISCNEIYVHGKIKGDMDVSGTTFLDNNATVAGNIVTNDILTNVGACVKGSVTSSRNADFDEDAEFDLGVDINGR